MSLRRVAGAIVLLALIFVIGGGATDTSARSTPWDCSDWQAFAHSDRTTAILESLAENRGKTLYCGLDQSDTFGKAETWAAGKDRNERDDTVYFGERGQFRGFIAAQEGWLTEGESGITGQSIAVIFEFPKEERRGRRIKYKRFAITGGPGVSSCGPDDAGGYITPRQIGSCVGGFATATVDANAARTNYNTDRHPTIDWPALAQRHAAIRCRQRGGSYARNIGIDGALVAPTYANNDNPIWAGYILPGNNHVQYQIRPWTATCVKKIKGSRR